MRWWCFWWCSVFVSPWRGHQLKWHFLSQWLAQVHTWHWILFSWAPLDTTTELCVSAAPKQTLLRFRAMHWMLANVHQDSSSGKLLGERKGLSSEALGLTWEGPACLRGLGGSSHSEFFQTSPEKRLWGNGTITTTGLLLIANSHWAVTPL